MRLNARDLDVLAAVYLCADRSIQEIAAELRLKPHAVIYSLQKLKAEEVIRPQPFINTYALGYFQAEFFVSLGIASDSERKKFERIICSSSEVPWLGRYGGMYHYGFTFCVKNLEEIFAHASVLMETVAHSVRDRAFGIRRKYTEYRFKNLSSKKLGRASIEFGMVPQMSEIDEIDHRILRTLCDFPDLSRLAAAEKLGMQASTFHYRVASLERRGILRGFTYVVDFKKLGFLTYVYLLRLRSSSEKIIERIRRFAETHADIIYLSEGIGGWEIQLAANVRDPEASMQIAQSLAEHFGAHILDLQTLSAFSYSKVLRYPFNKLPFEK